MARPVRFNPQQDLDGVVELFWERGYHDVCVEDIVHRTGLNRHTLYGSYGSKMGLFQAALDHYTQRNVQAIDDVLLGESPPEDRLAAILELCRKSDHPFWRDVLTRGCLASRTADELGGQHPELKQPMNTLGRHLVARIREVVGEAQASGQVRSELDADDVAAAIGSAVLAPLAWEGAATRPLAVLSLIR